LGARRTAPTTCYKHFVGLDLNIDLGELAQEPEQLYAIATTANIACGGHAGDAASIRRAVGLAVRYGTAVAAHPAYPDPDGFGRTSRFSLPDATRVAVEGQCTRLHEIAVDLGVSVRVVKPHGALYHDVHSDADLAGALIDGARRALPDLETFVGLPDTAFEDIVRARGLGFRSEGFADRRYDDRFRLVPRGRADALLVDAASCVSQALMLARIARFDTLCLHGDTPGALVLARAVRAALVSEGLLAAR